MIKVGHFVQKHRYWFVAGGLMVASSGLDGVYMARWMPANWAWLGLVLNTVADVCNVVLSTEYAKLQRKRDETKRAWSRLLLGGELAAVFYSWFFSWRQLRFVLPLVEVEDWQWVAPVAAGFIPVLLLFLGVAQGLDVTRFEKQEEAKPELLSAKPEPLRCSVCGATSGLTGAPFLTQAQLSGHMRAHAGGNGRKSFQPGDQVYTENLNRR